MRTHTLGTNLDISQRETASSSLRSDSSARRAGGSRWTEKGGAVGGRLSRAQRGVMKGQAYHGPHSNLFGRASFGWLGYVGHSPDEPAPAGSATARHHLQPQRYLSWATATARSAGLRAPVGDRPTHGACATAAADVAADWELRTGPQSALAFLVDARNPSIERVLQNLSVGCDLFFDGINHSRMIDHPPRQLGVLNLELSCLLARSPMKDALFLQVVDLLVDAGPRLVRSPRIWVDVSRQDGTPAD